MVRRAKGGPALGVDRLQSGDRVRQHLQIDAGLVHLADAQRAEIVEPLDDIATGAGTAAELLDLGVQVMLFERDDVGLLCHSCLPRILARASVVRRVGDFRLSFSVSAIPLFSSSRPSTWPVDPPYHAPIEACLTELFDHLGIASAHFAGAGSGRP